MYTTVYYVYHYYIEVRTMYKVREKGLIIIIIQPRNCSHYPGLYQPLFTRPPVLQSADICNDILESDLSGKRKIHVFNLKLFNSTLSKQI